MSDLLKLENFFKNEVVPKLKLAQDVADQLSQPVESGKFVAVDSKKPGFSLDGKGTFDVFKQPFSVSGSLGADLLIHAPEAEIPILEFRDPKTGDPVFEDAEIIDTPEGQVQTELLFHAKAGVEGRLLAPTQGTFILSAEAAAKGGFTYRHLRPSPLQAGADTSRFEGLADLVTTSRPPAMVPLAEIVPAEIHVFETLLDLSLGLEASFGRSFDVDEVVALFDGLSAELQVHAEFTLKASLGWSLYDHMQLAVGRFNTLEDGWVRVRAQRLRRRSLTLGAKASLEVSYDIGQQAFTTLLDRILDFEPMKRLTSALTEVVELQKEGGWDAVRDKLAGELAEEVTDFLDDNAWSKWVSASDQAKIDAFLGKAQKIVKAYDALPEKIQSLWDTLLAKADLGPDSKILRTLRQIAALEVDPEHLEQTVRDLLKDEDWEKALDLLELLAGESLEDLVLGQLDDVAKALGKAVELAQKALDFITELRAEPGHVIADIQSFAERTGIESAVEWLRQNATSFADLKARADARIQKLVERLVGKLWGELDEDDFKKLDAWLGRIEAVLAKKDEWEKKLRAAIAKLKGELGFSISIEMSRLTEKLALLDLEFDPADARLRKLVEGALHQGAARALLEKLPEGDEDSTALELGYRLRESLFSNRRVRSSALAVFSSFFGINNTRTTERIDEETVRISQEGGKLVRRGSYAGGTVRSVTGNSIQGSRSTELGAWLDVEVAGTGGELAARYGSVESRGLRITFAREDDKTQTGELTALDQLLFELGFDTAGATRPSDLLRAHNTRFSFELRFGEAATAAFLGRVAEKDWNLDYRNAGHRFFDEGLLAFKKAAQLKPSAPEGEVMATIIGDPFFVANWKDSQDFLDADQGRIWHLDLDGRRIQVKVTVGPGAGQAFLYPGVGDLIRTRGRTFDRFQKTSKAFTSLGKRPTPKKLRDLATIFSNTMGTSAFGVDWRNTLFNLWLVLARLNRDAPSALTDVKGMAVLRFRDDATKDWEKPIVWTLVNGVPPQSGPGSIFPFS